MILSNNKILAEDAMLESAPACKLIECDLYFCVLGKKLFQMLIHLITFLNVYMFSELKEKF